EGREAPDLAGGRARLRRAHGRECTNASPSGLAARLAPGGERGSYNALQSPRTGKGSVMSSIQHPVIDSAEAQRALKAAADSEGLHADQIDIESMVITQHWDR